MVLDFVGNATKHALMTPEDLLGGDYSDEEVEEAKKKAKNLYFSKAAAKRAASRVSRAYGKPMVGYRCCVCGLYHVGSRRPAASDNVYPLDKIQTGEADD